MDEHFSAVEAERRRLAELIEMQILNPLNLLLSQASAYEQTFGASPDTLLVISVLSALARQVLRQALDLQANLRPALLNVLGLEAALEVLAQQQAQDTGAQVSLKIINRGDRLPPPLELALFRAAQDALTVALKQARATRVEMTCQHEEAFALVIRDNGSVSIARHLLAETTQRITTLGGVLHSEPGAISLRFPALAAVQLTEREREVLLLVAQGLKNKEIASQLHLSQRTVNFHLNNLYAKLGVSTRTEAAVYALRYTSLSILTGQD